MNRSYGSVSKEEVLIVGEMIYLKMQRHPLLIKDRKHHLRAHTSCFVGKELVEWLVKNGEASNNADAVACMRVLQEHGIIHHVVDEHLFKNENLFYRFRIDDGTFFVDTEFEIYHQAIMIHRRVVGDSETKLMISHTVGDEEFENCFIASHFITWLIANVVVSDRYAAVVLGQQFVDMLVIKPVNGDIVKFTNDDTVYRFVFDVDFNLPLHRVLSIGGGEDMVVKSERSINRFAVQEINERFLSKFWEGVWEDKSINKTTSKLTDFNKNEEDVIPTLKPVVLRDVTVEELMSKETPYYWKNISITSDSVGFGFIIRGDGPCYVQAVDPTSPAATAGLKVRMYLYSVNGKVVLNMVHTDIGKEIVKSKVLDLVVLQHLRSSS